MRKLKLIKEEQDIEDAIGEFVPVSRAEYGEIVQAINAKKSRLKQQNNNIR